MPREHASLQRRPFLMPIWLLGLAALAGLVGMGCFGLATWAWATADSTTVVVIRHAEKEAGGGDPALTPTGQARAVLLTRMFGDRTSREHIDAIYVSSALRNRQTAAPLAAKLGLTPAVVQSGDSHDLARRVLHEQSGKRILIVGHRDTVPGLVEALSGVKPIPALGAEEYGTMYVVAVPRIGHANVMRLTY